MKYIYKRNRYYFYKRRIPFTNKFYSFNTKLRNYKKAVKIIIIFNKITRDIFDYLRFEGNDLSITYEEIVKVLDDYKDRALIEYKELEEKRHSHLSKLFKIEKEDLLMGKTILSGAQPEVIEQALQSFENLATGNYNQTKTALKKYGKEIVQRTTPELKNLYSKFRNIKNEKEFLNFLSMLFKVESEILKVDLQRANNRFGIDTNNYIEQSLNKEQKLSYIEEEIQKVKSIDDIAREFLYDYCNYKDESFVSSKSNASKVKKIIELFIDFTKDTKKIHTSEVINERLLKDVMNIIPEVPKKDGNISGNYSFYEMYKLGKNEKHIELRGVATIKDALSSFKRFIEFLTEKKYITEDIKKSLLNHLKNVKKDINTKVTNNIINDESDVEAFSDDMLLKIFNKDVKPYCIVFKKLKSLDIKDIDIYITRFYAPLIMFLTGSRLAEIVHLKTYDCDIEVHKDKERLLLYIEANEQKGSKTKTSKRIILVHDFLANDLNLINFVKKAKRENREYLFNTVKEDEERVSKAFNRDKEFLKGTLTRKDEFFNTKYSLYSFRHLYKTHMQLKNINESVIHKLQGHKEKDSKVTQGYFSYTDDLIEVVNRFDKHKIIDWTDFIDMTKKFCFIDI